MFVVFITFIKNPLLKGLLLWPSYHDLFLKKNLSADIDKLMISVNILLSTELTAPYFAQPLFYNLGDSFCVTLLLMKITVLSLFVGSLMLQSCGVNLKDALIVKKGGSEYLYNLTDNGCSTGDQSFSSLTAMCENLKNDSANNFCAYELRRSKFETDCFSTGTWN